MLSTFPIRTLSMLLIIILNSSVTIPIALPYLSMVLLFALSFQTALFFLPFTTPCNIFFKAGHNVFDKRDRGK